MTNVKPYIDEDGEVRALDEHFFKTAKRGRPPLPESQKRKPVSIKLDPRILAYFKGENPKGWQTRVNDALLEFIGVK